MSSSSKDRSNSNRDDCQIHVDKEGESCVIKIESVGQEKLIKELLNRFSSFKSEIDQFLTGQQQPKEMIDAIQDMTSKLKPLEDQLHKMTKHVGDDHVQLNKFHTDIDKKFDDIKQDLNNLKEQQKNIDKILKTSYDDGQKNDSRPVLDAIHTFQTSFDKEKTKPDILARKLDSIDQKLKESQPEQTALIKDIQTKFDPLHKASLQTNETLTKINDRIKAIHIDSSKIHPDIMKKLDLIDHHLKNQQTSIVEPIQQYIYEKISSLSSMQRKDGEEKFGSSNINERDDNSNSPKRTPLCLNGMMPVLPKLSDPNVLPALANDIGKKLNEIQAKLSPNEEFKSLTPTLQKLKQQQEIDNEHLSQNLHKSSELIIEKLNDLHTKIENLFKEQQPLVDKVRGLSQSYSHDDKLSLLTQSIKTIKDGFDQQTQNYERDNKVLIHIDEKLNNINQDLEKKFHRSDETMKTLSNDILMKLNELQLQSESVHRLSIDPTDFKKKNDDICSKIDQIVDQIQLKNSEESIQNLSPELIHSLSNLNNNLSLLDDLTKRLITFKGTVNHTKATDQDSPFLIKDVHSRLKDIDETIKILSEQILMKPKCFSQDNERINIDNLRQVPLSQTVSQNTNNFMNTFDDQQANLFTNLLMLETMIRNATDFPCQDIQQYLKRIEQSRLVKTDFDLQRLVERVKNFCSPNNKIQTGNDQNKNLSDRYNIQQTDMNNNLIDMNNVDRSRIYVPIECLTKSRYILLLNDQIIHDYWPKLPPRSMSIIQTILDQPLEFDNGTNLDQLIKQNGLEQYALLTKKSIEKSDKDYDKVFYMMDSIVFDKMTMIGSREALVRPWNPALLNRASSDGPYPYPAKNGQTIQRFPVNKNISLWMVETDNSKPYFPSKFLPNIERLNEKYDKIQQPQFQDIRQRQRADETRWNERYPFINDKATGRLFNDLRSYFMDYDTKRKYQVHDDVPINPVCRTGIAGRGDLPFWGPNHCVVIVLLRNTSDPDVVLMKHHGNAFVLPKGFYGQEVRYNDHIKVIQDPISGQILPPKLFDFWWSQVIKLNESNGSINHLKRVLNDKEMKEEFAEIFSQIGCNKSVFDNGYVDHPLNTDHAWVESGVWKIQFKDWRIPEMRTMKYAIADDIKLNNDNKCAFVWMKLTDALLIVPPFDRGILIDVLATGMPL